jgi:hypothetical protein
MKRGGLLAMLIAAIALGVTDRGLASPATLPYPVDLRVLSEGGAWHTHTAFLLEWDSPAAAGLPVVAAGYRLRDATGTIVREGRRDGDRQRLEVQVPSVPGSYTTEVWLEGPDGGRGPTASAVLRYDNARPGSPKALAPSGWLAADSAARIEVQPPLGPAPISGVSGYAVSVDHGAESWPCATRDICTDAEIDLTQSTEGGTVSLGILPEGVSVVRVVAVSGAGVPSSEPGTAFVRVDATRPEVTLAGVPRGWVDGPVRILATATDPISGMAPDGPNGPFTALAVDDGAARIGLGDSTSAAVTGEGLHRVDAYARDAAGNVDSDQPHTVSVAIDESPPRVSFAVKQDPAEPERIEAALADALSGVDPGRGSIGVREAGTSQPWRSLRTTATDGRLIAHWDSDSYPEGIYEFRAIGYDRAGNVAATNQRENHTRMVLINPLKSRVRLQAGLAGGMRPSARVPYGRGLVYHGQVTSAGGSPLGGLPVQVIESFEPGAAAGVKTSRVVSAADGSFAIRLPRGPSRQVEARFSGSRSLGSAQSGQARLEVLAAVGMRTSTSTARVGGAPIVFSGRVGRLGARLPRGGLPVDLQFRVPGGGWAEFRTVQTDRGGRFRYPYAFSDDDSRGVRFQFRAYISGGDWPYEPAASKAVSVTGR